MQQRHHTFLFATLAACALVLVLVVVAVVVRSRSAPAPQPVAVVQTWCVDPVNLLLLGEEMCEGDFNNDGYIDGHLYVPVKGQVKPVKGGKLPASVKLDQTRTIRIPVQRPGQEPAKQLPAPVSPKKPASSKRTGLR